MNTNLPLITCDDETTLEPVLVSFFSLQKSKRLFLVEPPPDMDFLNTLVFRIAKKPRCLLTHLQRIYYCYQAQLADQLYAALVDLLIVLNRRGSAISRRMVIGARSVLSVNQLKTLLRYLQNTNIDYRLLPGNHYSIFSKGIIGTTNMLHITDKKRTDIDPLMLARDFIEYSQLEEALTVLEAAILEQPDRLELHEELLTLYQSTRNVSSFNQMYSELTHSGLDVPDAWQFVNAYFKELNQDG
jgi:hypothetical protein